MRPVSAFLDRLFQHLTSLPIREYLFRHWAVPGKVTNEAVGLLPVPGADPEKIAARVMDVDHYVGNVAHVCAARSIPDPAYPPPNMVRFYQRVKIPVIGELHQELVLERAGPRDGYQVLSWRLLERETEALSPKQAIRPAYLDGAWLMAPGVLGYALSSCPRREDVGLLKWKALTTGADVAAAGVFRENIEGMARWAR